MRKTRAVSAKVVLAHKKSFSKLKTHFQKKPAHQKKTTKKTKKQKQKRLKLNLKTKRETCSTFSNEKRYLPRAAAVFHAEKQKQNKKQKNVTTGTR